jgi:hypothetical protein
VVALALMISQAFFYNAIFCTYSLVLTRFMNVPESLVALYIFPFALGNVLAKRGKPIRARQTPSVTNRVKDEKHPARV